MARASRLVPRAAPKMTASAFLCVLSRASFQVGARFPRTGAAYSRSGLMQAVYTVLSTLMLAPALGVVMSLRALRRWRHLVRVYSAWGPNVILESRMIPRYLCLLTHSRGWLLMWSGSRGAVGKAMALVLLVEMVRPMLEHAVVRLFRVLWSVLGQALTIARSSA